VALTWHSFSNQHLGGQLHDRRHEHLIARVDACTAVEFVLHCFLTADGPR
jgi:hypothetical protein